MFVRLTLKIQKIEIHLNMKEQEEIIPESGTHIERCKLEFSKFLYQVFFILLPNHSKKLFMVIHLI